MDFSSNEPDKVFDYYVTRRFQLLTFQLLIRCYERAAKDCRRLVREVAHDHFAYQRRALIEDRWLKLAKSQGIFAESELNQAHNWHHTTVRIGSIVWIVQAVEHPGESVRQAIYRDSLLEANQLLLFSDQMIRPATNSPVCAILLHGPTTSKVPLFANIMFPLPLQAGVGAYHEKRIPLFVRFPKTVATIRTPEVETILDSIRPEIRTDIPKTGEDV